MDTINDNRKYKRREMSKILTKKEISDFRDFYLEILLFSYINRLELEEYYIDDIVQFITTERSFFYKNRHSTISEYIKMKGTFIKNL